MPLPLAGLRPRTLSLFLQAVLRGLGLNATTPNHPYLVPAPRLRYRDARHATARQYDCVSPQTHQSAFTSGLSPASACSKHVFRRRASTGFCWRAMRARPRDNPTVPRLYDDFMATGFPACPAIATPSADGRTLAGGRYRIARLRDSRPVRPSVAQVRAWRSPQAWLWRRGVQRRCGRGVRCTRFRGRAAVWGQPGPEMAPPCASHGGRARNNPTVTYSPIHANQQSGAPRLCIPCAPAIL